jgi:hypothetical protein
VSKLPKKASLTVDVFETAVELTSPTYDAIFKFLGDFKTELNGRRSTIKSNLGISEGIVKGGNK